MPRITDIKPTNRPGRYSVYLDGRFGFALGDLELSASSLKIGSELSTKEVKDWQDRAAESKVQAAALRYIAIRPRSTHELREYLRRKEYEAGEIDAAQEYLESYSYLDDTDFARRWVEYRQATSQRSTWRLGNELRAKGIAADVIAEVLQGQDESIQVEALAALIAKKRGRYTDEQKLIAYCLRQGFPIGLIRRTLAESAE